MFEEQSQQEVSSLSTVRVVLAIILIALAIPLGIWVLTIVNGVINDTKTPAILQVVNPNGNKPVYIETPAGKTELPSQLFTVMSYMVLCFFLFIPTTITIALIKSSVALLNPDLKSQLRDLTKFIKTSIAPKQ